MIKPERSEKNEWQTYRASSLWYELMLPVEWSVEAKEENYTAFFDERNGVGALQISVYQFPKHEEVDPKKQLEKYLNEHGYGGKGNDIHAVSSGGKKIAMVSLVEKNDFWKYWFIVGGDRKLIFATYNCNVNDRSKEQEIVDRIIDSLEIS